MANKRIYKKIIVALDGMSAGRALKIAESLKDLVWGFKVNDLLYADFKIIKKLKKYGKVFADVKLYDIPNTVANSVQRLSKIGADIITVHASGGTEMMRIARKNSGKSKIMAVTILTSKKLKSEREVLNLAKEAIKAEVDGLVCSGHELKSINKLKGAKSFIKIVPGIRPIGFSKKDDQTRTMTAQEALKSGADYLVSGRPLTQSKNILRALKSL